MQKTIIITKVPLEEPNEKGGREALEKGKSFSGVPFLLQIVAALFLLGLLG